MTKIKQGKSLRPTTTVIARAAVMSAADAEHQTLGRCPRRLMDGSTPWPCKIGPRDARRYVAIRRRSRTIHRTGLPAAYITQITACISSRAPTLRLGSFGDAENSSACQSCYASSTGRFGGVGALCGLTGSWLEVNYKAMPFSQAISAVSLCVNSAELLLNPCCSVLAGIGPTGQVGICGPAMLSIHVEIVQE